MRIIYIVRYRILYLNPPGVNLGNICDQQANNLSHYGTMRSPFDVQSGEIVSVL